MNSLVHLLGIVDFPSIFVLRSQFSLGDQCNPPLSPTQPCSTAADTAISKSNVTCTPSSESDSGVTTYPADPTMQSAWKWWKILWNPQTHATKILPCWHLNELILNYTYWFTKYWIFENQCFKLERAKIEDEHVKVCSCWVYGRNDRRLEAKYHTADSKQKLALPLSKHSTGVR